MIPLFRTRDPDRDRLTDEKRIGKVCDAIGTALAEARRERGGLARRMESVATSAGFLAGTDLGDAGRDPKDEARLREMEAQLTRGRERLAELDDQVEQLELNLVDLNMDGKAAPSP